MVIFKLKDLTPDSQWYLGREILRQYRENPILFAPCKVMLKYKDGRRRRFKKLHILSLKSWPCETCGEHWVIDIRIGGENKTLKDV